MLPDFRVRQRDYLLEIIRALSQQLNLETVLARILEAAADMLGGQAGLIALRDESLGNMLRVRTQYRVTPEFVRHFDAILRDASAPNRRDPAGYVISEIERRLFSKEGRFNLEGTVGLPLQLGDELLGIMLVFRPIATPFGIDEQQLLVAFTAQAAIAVKNASLYQQSVNERRRLDAVLDGSADGIAIMDSGHRIQRWSRALTRLTGIAAATAVGGNHNDVIRWRKREPGLDLNEAEAGGWPFSSASPLYVEGDLIKTNGSAVAVGITYAPIFDRENRLVNLVANVRDITRFREAEQLKSTFISVVSHELKTPVSLIKGYAGTLRRDDARWDAQTVQESLAVIEEEADRLTSLIENLLDASRLQAGAMKLTLNDVALDEMAAQLATEYRTQSEKHTFVVEFPPAFPLVQGDEERLRQVLTNFLSNAIKYSPEGGVIRITGRAEPERVTVSVSDEGPGLADDDLDKIFDRFYRADTPTTRRVKGAGLGLYLAKAVIDAHDGQIWADSEQAKGATFSFSLPRNLGT